MSVRDRALHTVRNWALVELLEAYPEELGEQARPSYRDGVRSTIGLGLSINGLPGLRTYRIPEPLWRIHFPEDVRQDPLQLKRSGKQLVADLFRQGYLSRGVFDHNYHVTVEPPAVIGPNAIFVQTHQRPH